MKTCKKQTENGTFAVEFRASVLGAIERYCRNVGSVETGGILVGGYSDDRGIAIVREASPPPPDSK